MTASNIYASLASFKSALRLTGSSDDASALALLDDVGRAIDETCNRQFFAATATRYFDAVNAGERELWVDDIVSLSALVVDADGDGVYEITLVADDDYWLYPDSPPANNPRVRIDLNPNGQLATWPTGRRRVKATGIFGFSNESELTGQTVLDAPLSDSATSINVTSSASIGVGDMLPIEAEQVLVTAIPDATHVTVLRALNGTTAASHVATTPIYRRRYPRPIERAAILQASRLWRETQTGGSGNIASPQFGGSTFSAMYPAIRDLLRPFVRMGGVR